MKKIVAAAALFCFCSMLYATEPGDGNLKGKITDSKTSGAIEFVNVSVYDITGKNLIKGTITDTDGKFSIPHLNNGTYILKASFIGYRTIEKQIKITDDTDFLKLVMSEDSELLDEVEIVGQKPQMMFDIDKKIFNVDQALSAIGGSASDILNDIPSIEVDSEGTVSLRGDEGVTIWINGKESGLTADNQSQILEQLPAETIDRVEVITNPSSKYSSEGSAGIINIILKKDNKAGYYGGVQARATSKGMYNASANINFTKGKWDAYANIGYRHMNGENEGYTNRYMENDTYLKQTSEGKREGNNGFTRLGVTYHPTVNDDISLNGFGMMGKGNNNNTINYTSNVPGSYSTARRLSLGDTDMNGGNANLDYTHRFSEKHFFNLSASYNVWAMNGSTDYLQTSVYDSPETHEVKSAQRQISDSKNGGWEFQADYSNEINENNKIEAGYKGELKTQTSPIDTWSGTTVNDLAPQDNLYNDFRYDMDIHALYVAYTGKIKGFGVQAGLRGEYTKTDSRTKYKEGGVMKYDTFNDNYFDLFPSLFLSYSLPKNNELQVNYTRRLRRPRGHMINSFRNITDSTNISYGNPALSPQYSNAFELNYIKTWPQHTLSVSGYYRTTDNVFERISYMDENRIMNSTWFNVTSSKSAGVELVSKNKLFNILDLTSTVNMYYYRLEGFEYFDSRLNKVLATGEPEENFSWDARIIANFKLPYDISLQATGRYRSRSTVAQGYRKPNYSIDAGLKKSFLNNTLSIAINARDILNSRKRETFTSGDGFWQDSSNMFIGRNIGVTVSYSFGNLRDRLKRAMRPQPDDSNMSEEEEYLE